MSPFAAETSVRAAGIPSFREPPAGRRIPGRAQTRSLLSQRNVHLFVKWTKHARDYEDASVDDDLRRVADAAARYHRAQRDTKARRKELEDAIRAAYPQNSTRRIAAQAQLSYTRIFQIIHREE